MDRVKSGRSTGRPPARRRGASRCSPVPACRRPAASRRSAARTACGAAIAPRSSRPPQAFARDPALLWEWYGWRRETIARCAPNAAHEVLARWSRGGERTTVVTQNVDDLHLKAGTERLVRLHGSIWELSCSLACCEAGRTRVARRAVRRCRACRAARTATRWRVRRWCGSARCCAEADLRAAVQATACDVFLTVGTSALVYPAAGLVEQARLQRRVHRRDQRGGHAGDGDRGSGDSGAGGGGAAGGRSPSS